MLDEQALPAPYRFALARAGHIVLITMIPGYDRVIVAAHAARHRPQEEQAAIRDALGLPAPAASAVEAARRALNGNAGFC